MSTRKTWFKQRYYAGRCRHCLREFLLVFDFSRFWTSIFGHLFWYFPLIEPSSTTLWKLLQVLKYSKMSSWCQKQWQSRLNSSKWKAVQSLSMSVIKTLTHLLLAFETWLCPSVIRPPTFGIHSKYYHCHYLKPLVPSVTTGGLFTYHLIAPMVPELRVIWFLWCPKKLLNSCPNV